jgi:hypothetical protein
MFNKFDGQSKRSFTKLKKRRPGFAGTPLNCLHIRRSRSSGEAQSKRNLVHSAHAAAWRSTMSACCCGLLVVFSDVGHQSFDGEHQAGDACLRAPPDGNASSLRLT